MVILILTNNDIGLYKFRKELIQELIRQNNEIYVALPKGEYFDKFKKIGCQIVDTNIDRRGTNPVKDFELILTYNKILNFIKPNIVLTYTIKPNVYGGILCGLKKIPYISNVTGLGCSIENSGLIQKVTLFLYRIGLAKSNKIFFQNQSNKEYFEKHKIAKKNVQLIPGSGVNLTQHCLEPYPDNDGSIRLLFIGRVMKDKGIQEFITCAKKIKSYYSNVFFDIVGPYEEEYQGQLNELDKEGTIKYFGQQDDIHSIIKTHHATVLPSYHEGMANVLLESAACGRPVLASRIPGCSETFDEDISGFGFEPKNAEDLYRALEKFISLPYDRKITMGLAGRKKVEKEFDRRIVIHAYLEEINKICQ